MKEEAPISSETSVLTRATRRNIPEDDILLQTLLNARCIHIRKVRATLPSHSTRLELPVVQSSRCFNIRKQFNCALPSRVILILFEYIASCCFGSCLVGLPAGLVCITLSLCFVAVGSTGDLHNRDTWDADGFRMSTPTSSLRRFPARS
jgi:hypothetical protein